MAKRAVVPHKPKEGNSLAEARPDIAREWDPNRNGGMTPNDLSRGSAYVAWWKCDRCGKGYRLMVDARTAGGRGCPYCAKENVLEARGKARSTTEQFAAKMAGINPDIEIVGEFAGYRNKVRVRCRKCGREWDASPYNLIVGRGCASCSRRKITEE